MTFKDIIDLSQIDFAKVFDAFAKYKTTIYTFIVIIGALFLGYKSYSFIVGDSANKDKRIVSLETKLEVCSERFVRYRDSLGNVTRIKDSITLEKQSRIIEKQYLILNKQSKLKQAL